VRLIRYLITAILSLLSLILITSCSSTATRFQFYKPITAEVNSGRYDVAAAKIDAARAKNKFADKDRFIFLLDSGLLYHYAEKNDTSNARLTRAETAADELYTKSVSRAAASLLLNDNVLEYSGEDYEILYTNLFKALNYIRYDSLDEAFVEIRRANEKLNLLEQKYAGSADKFIVGDNSYSDGKKIDYTIEKVKFNNDAFARYLSMHMYASEGKYDDARIDSEFLSQAFLTQPQIYDFPKPAIKYASDSLAILSVVGLAGLAPVKQPLNLRIRTDKQLDLVQVLYTDGDQANTEYGHLMLPISQDFYFKFSLPRIIPQPSAVRNIRVYANNELVGNLQLIEDVTSVAQETFKAKQSLIYFRTIARALAKGVGTHKLKSMIDNSGKSDNDKKENHEKKPRDSRDNPDNSDKDRSADTDESDGFSGSFGKWLLKGLIDVASDLSENADLRCSQFLPGQIYVGDFEIAPGTYDLKIEFLDATGTILKQVEVHQYKVMQNNLNLVEAVGVE
jgi:uncharacterized protein